MRILSVALAIASCALALSALATPSFAAGFRFITGPAGADGPALAGALWYPCAEPPGTLQLGPYLLPVTKDCPLSGDKHPLIVVSHGGAGTFLGHHDTAEAFADAGFIVAAITHPGQKAQDNSRINALSAFASRPGDIKRLIDYLLGSPAAPFIDPSRIGFFGFSRGGFTGLALIGANADWANATTWCGDSPSGFCPQVRNRDFPAGPIFHDPRIKAAVLADPFAVFFTAESLASIRVPVQLWASEHGGDGVSLRDVAPLDKTLSSPHEFHLVKNAGHFAFFLCPTTLAEAEPDLCTDKSGFDRAAFHQEFNAAALKFLQDNMK